MGDSEPLPIILAGPILRRVEPARVCVWIATSQACLVSGLVYDATATKQFGQGKTGTIRLGEALHVAVVEIMPISKEKSPAYPTRTLLAYDLILEITGKDGKILGRQLVSNLTSGSGVNILAYAPYFYPTFFMDDASLNILHGSCRKAHGAGDDALACADTILQNTASDLTNRPSALFLTGDQIYADDVHDELITPISKFGRALLGFDERVPGITVPIHELAPMMRRKVASEIFSPDADAKNQLFGFGDFAGLYLFAFNGELWKGRLTPRSEELKRFHQALPAVRRILANIATYMIFDDHELTDDWNLSKTWEDRALHGPSPRAALGKRVITHALCAYWAFQGWGNKPEAFDTKFRKTITDYFAKPESNGGKLEDLLLETHLWFFAAPTTPPVFFLDSRTRRMASTVRPSAPSALLNDAALRDLHTETSRINSKWLIIVAQTPVFGSPASERYLEENGFENEAAAEEYDLEIWHANRAGYYKLLQTLQTLAPTGCIILSGDVHYGFVSRASVAMTGSTVPFTQFTSSALKNAATGKSGVALSAIRDEESLLIEQGWMNAPKCMNPGASKRIRELLAASPTVLTGAEYIEAKIMTKSDALIINQPIRPTTPSDGYFLHTQTNIGQLILPLGGDATLRFYGPSSKDPFATYKVQIDSLPRIGGKHP